MEKVEHVLIFDFLRFNEVMGNIHGDSITLKALLRELEDECKIIDYVSYRELGLLGKVINLLWVIKSKNRKSINSSRIRWVSTALLYISIDKFHFFRVSFPKEIKKILENHSTLIVLGRPYFFSHFEKLLKNGKINALLLLEHNFEKLFFEFQIGREGLFSKHLLKDISKIEMHALSRASAVYTVSPRDEIVLSAAFPNLPIKRVNYGKVDEFISLPPILFPRKMNSYPYSNIYDPVNNVDHLKVGFIGSNYSLNVRSVEIIIEMAKKLINEKIDFVIIGEVALSFKNRTDIPPNIIFLGFIQDTFSALSMCDTHILFELMPTGIETKALLYRQFGKLVILIGSLDNNYNEILGDRAVSLRNKEDGTTFLINLCASRKIANFTILNKKGIILEVENEDFLPAR